jgi:hypothetical protein
MTQPTPSDPSPSAMPAQLPGAEPEQPEHKRQWTSEEYDAEITKLRKENASWRTKYREAATDLEAAASQLGAMRHAEIERLAAEHLKAPADVWQAQPDAAAFLDDEYGTVDPAKVAEVAQSLVTEKPHYAADKRVAPPPSDRPVESLRSGAIASGEKPTQPSWRDVIPRPLGRMAPGE